MKTLTAVIASTIIGVASSAAIAQTTQGGTMDRTQDTQGTQTQGTMNRGQEGTTQGQGAWGEQRDTGSAFSVIDRNGDGHIDREEAAAAGISNTQFQQMDSDGSGQVSESDYRDFIGQGGQDRDVDSEHDAESQY